MECCNYLWIAKRTLRSSVSRNSHSPRSTLVLQCTDLSPFVYMWDRVGLLTITGLRFGYEFYNKMCSIYIKGLTIKLLILITDALAQWRVWNACVIVSIHRNTLKDGTLLSTWIKGGMDNPLSSLADLVYNTSIALFKVFLTTSHPIVIVSLIKEEESEKIWRDGQWELQEIGRNYWCVGVSLDDSWMNGCFVMRGVFAWWM